MNAEKLNAHLAGGGVVQITTYGKSWVYEKPGCFVQKNGSLYVKRGKALECLSIGERLLVGIRLGRYQQA